MTIVHIDPEAVRLKRKIRKHFKSLGFGRADDGSLRPINDSKETYRKLHEHQRNEKVRAHKKFLDDHKHDLVRYFADGNEVNPTQIRPALEVVYGDSWQSDLFRFASLQWRVPVSDGYGRRIRFLVWDKSNEKLIGLIALGDPVFNLAVRDELIGWDHNARKARLTGIMDAYVLGAVPPYNLLLGGKLVASLVKTREIVDHFKSKYKDTRGIISGKKKNPSLAMVTTSSALGRSSIYNRLRLDGVNIFRPIGYTSGWGHFHISDNIFSEIREFLESRDELYSSNHAYGNGPNWKLRAIKKSFTLLGLNEQMARHHLVREVFVCELASNAKKYLRGDNKTTRYSELLTVDEMSRRAINRWVIPRSIRRPEYVSWNRAQILSDLKLSKVSQLQRAL
jgi:hypothetical protein